MVEWSVSVVLISSEKKPDVDEGQSSTPDLNNSWDILIWYSWEVRYGYGA